MSSSSMKPRGSRGGVTSSLGLHRGQGMLAPPRDRRHRVATISRISPSLSSGAHSRDPLVQSGLRILESRCARNEIYRMMSS
jgi:hypothetical protein